MSLRGLSNAHFHSHIIPAKAGEEYEEAEKEKNHRLFYTSMKIIVDSIPGDDDDNNKKKTSGKLQHKSNHHVPCKWA